MNKFTALFLFLIFILSYNISNAQSSNKTAASFNGTNSHIAIPDNSALNPTTATTMEAWIYPKISQCATIMGKNYTSNYWFGLCNNLRFYAKGNASSVTSQTIIPINKWTHVAVTYDGTTTKIYINGQLDFTGTPSVTGAMVANSDSLFIGGDVTGYFFNGYISNVRIWNIARTASDIQNNMNLQLTGTISGLAASYVLDNDFKDKSGNNDGISRNVTFNTIVSVEKIELPTEYVLKQNYPNPFNPSTTIKYSLPKNEFVMIRIFDVLGREVSTLVNEEKQPGNYEISFNAANLPSGTYYYKIDAGEFSQTKKMILIK